jgi:hypothetical protein
MPGGGRITGLTGPARLDAVKQALAPLEPQIHACALQMRRHGRYRVAVTLRGNGRVEARANKTDPEIEACMEQLVQSARFPAVDTASRFTYTFFVAKSLRDQVRYRVVP